MTDAALLARCRTGDQRAWTELIEAYSRYVYAILLQAYRLDDAEAQDAFQEVFTRVFQKLDGLRDDSALRPWIGQLTRRIAIDRLRARRPEHVADELPDTGSPDATLEMLADAMTVRQELAGLPGPCADMLDRFYARDESYRQIGAALGVPTGTVSSRIARCLEKLRVALESTFASLPESAGGR